MFYTLLVLTIFPGAMILAALMDMFTMTIPNRLSLALVGAFLLLAPFSGLSLAEFGWHLLAGLSMLGLGFLLFSAGWIGGGDAKLFAATALWFGFNSTLYIYAVYAALFGGLLTIILIAFHLSPYPEILKGQKWLERLHGLKKGIPYGIALAVAGAVVFPDTFWVQNMI